MIFIEALERRIAYHVDIRNKLSIDTCTDGRISDIGLSSSNGNKFRPVAEKAYRDYEDSRSKEHCQHSDKIDRKLSALGMTVFENIVLTQPGPHFPP